ncbi:serine carboxypeptidase-like 50 [Quercus suber]|uniref:Serine carboxypeptidase-like 50 n=1 Tax=Quercus suber TaxID=58331 RepID=A0AAW0IPM3_QUESU
MTPKEIPRDQLSVAKHLFAAITSFIELDPLLFKSRPLYFAGESYAGKYVPAIGYYILKANNNLPVSQQVNLGGVAIGNGLTDPITQVATHAYYSGLINERQKSVLEKAQWEAIKLTKMRKWRLATNARSEVLRMLQGMTGLATLHDFSKKAHYKTEMVFAFLRKKEVRKALGLNTSKIYDLCSNDVATALHDDFMKSVKFMVEFLVKKSKVLLYQGHFDLRDSVLSTEAWVKTIKWEGLNQFLMANRKVWRVNGELAGSKPLALEQNPGESYAGKDVPAIGYYILKKNPYLTVSKPLNLVGFAIGNGLKDSVIQVATHAMNAYYSGLINERQKSELEEAQSQWDAVKLTKMGNWRAATNAKIRVLYMLQSMTGLATSNDISKKVPYSTELLSKFLQKKEVKKALGVNVSMIHKLYSDGCIAQ